METGTQSSKRVLEAAERSEGVKHPTGGQYTGHGPLAKSYEGGFGKQAWEKQTEAIPGVKPAKEAGAAVSDFLLEGKIPGLGNIPTLAIIEVIGGAALILFGLVQLGKSGRIGL